MATSRTLVYKQLYYSSKESKFERSLEIELVLTVVQPTYANWDLHGDSNFLIKGRTHEMENIYRS
jgi:hypothetical protein